MAAIKRVPSKLTWEQHLHFAAKLRDFWTFLERHAMDRKSKTFRAWLYYYFLKLRSEMDEFVFIDCKDKPENARFDVYYCWDFSPDISRYGYSQTREDLIELREALQPTNPKGKAVKYIDIMLAKMSKAGV